MLKWLREITIPTWMLLLCAMTIGIASALGPDGSELPKRADVVSYFAFPFVIASWVIADARRRRQRLCYDYDSFVYFAWPVVVPVYLFQTRGLRAFLTLLWFAVIMGLGIIAASVAFRIREL